MAPGNELSAAGGRGLALAALAFTSRSVARAALSHVRVAVIDISGRTPVTLAAAGSSYRV
jgi:hypothetical protein